MRKSDIRTVTVFAGKGGLVRYLLEDVLVYTTLSLRYHTILITMTS